MAWLRRLLGRLWAFVTRHSLGVLASLGATIVLALTTHFAKEKFDEARAGPKEYKVYVVGGKAKVDGRNDFAFYMKQAIEQTWREYGDLTVDGKRVTVEYREDDWHPDKAAEVSKQLAERDDIVLVIGHFSSSTTKRAQKNYLGAEPPIPLIFTTETNPNLLPERQDNEPQPVFRLWPTDDEQARSIVEFLTSKTVFWVLGAEVPQVIASHKNIWVVEDASPHNAVYSHYLAREIVKRLQRAGMTVILWSNNKSIPPASTLEALNIDAVIFPGTTVSALIFVSQLRELWEEEWEKSFPYIFLTDATMNSVNSPIFKRRKHLEVLDGVHVSHPALISCQDIASIEGTLSETAKLAADAATIARRLIERARDHIETPLLNWFFGVHDVESLRRAIIQEMAKPVPYQGKDGKEYRFGEGGIDEYGRFRLWQIQDRRFVPLDRDKECMTASVEPSVEWIKILLGNLESNREALAEKFSLLRAAAVLNGKVLAQYEVSDEELTAFGKRIDEKAGYFGQTVRAYFTNLHSNAVKLVKLRKLESRLDSENSSEDERTRLIQRKEKLLSWFNEKSLRLSQLFRKHLQLELPGR